MTSPGTSSKSRKGQPATVTIDRLDVEALHSDLELLGKWTTHAIMEAARASGGRDRFPTLTHVLCAAATWRGRLAVALRNPDGTTMLRALASSPGDWWDPTAGAEAEPAPSFALPTPPAATSRYHRRDLRRGA